MKGNSGSVWRTVLLAAFMCLAAGEAYGYEVWDGSDLSGDRSGVFVVEEYQKVEIDNLDISDEVCLEIF